MNLSSILFLITALIASFIVAYAMKRGGLCTYAAVSQIVNERKGERMYTFLGASAWATLISIPLFWLWPDFISLSLTHDELITATIGGIVLGIGAHLNKGCIFGTFIKLVGGNLTYLATLIGMSLGVIFINQTLNDIKPIVSTPSQIMNSTQIALYWLIAALFMASLMMLKVKIFKSKLVYNFKQQGLEYWHPIFTILIIGIGGGLLYMTVNGWDYAAVLTNATFKLINPQAIGPSNLAILCTLFMVIGGVYAAISMGNFSIRVPRLIPFIKSLVGGALMGGGAIIVPGGNDGLLLKGIPSFAPHAIIGYFLMVTTMLSILYFMFIIQKKIEH